MIISFYLCTYTCMPNSLGKYYGRTNIKKFTKKKVSTQLLFLKMHQFKQKNLRKFDFLKNEEKMRTGKAGGKS